MAEGKWKCNCPTPNPNSLKSLQPLQSGPCCNPSTWELRQEDGAFQTSLGYIERLYSNNSSRKKSVQPSLALLSLSARAPCFGTNPLAPARPSSPTSAWGPFPSASPPSLHSVNPANRCNLTFLLVDLEKSGQLGKQATGLPLPPGSGLSAQ